MLKTIPELLSPVGGRAQLEAAINNGADAVYMGGSLFNARINAENFDDEGLLEAIDLAHESGVKVYITFNTLIKDGELLRAFRYACSLYEMGADALILQDMGLAHLVHKYLPDFPIHLSTQGTVYNEYALDLVRKLGFNRVVPARELSLEELNRFCSAAHDAPSIEVEVFVHGALCMCYSGQCQMSRAFGGGGRSGNRGLCAQPCRLLYTDDRGRKGYFLSPKDLCTLELIPQLIAAGADSFKIEGRLKSPEYVAVTTAVYRKYLDLYAELIRRQYNEQDLTETWKTQIDPEDILRLKRVFNRGGFTTGYLEENPGVNILSGQSPKNQGIYIGKVTGVTEIGGGRKTHGKAGGQASGKDGGKSGRDKVLVDVKLIGDSTVVQGDGFEIRRGSDGFKTAVSDMTEVTDPGTPAATVPVGGGVATYVEKQSQDVIRIGDFDRGVQPGDSVFKVTDKRLREEALSVPVKRGPVEMRFEARLGEKPALSVQLKQSDGHLEATSEEGSVKVFGDFAVERALKKPVNEQKIREQLLKLGGTRFCAAEEDVLIEMDPEIMIPVSIINSMRREAIDALSQREREQVRTDRVPLSGKKIEEIITIENLGSEDEVKRVERREKDSIPHILHVSKGQLDEEISRDFDSIAAKVQETGILIGNLGWVKQFLDAGVKVYGDHGLNAYNSQAVKAYEELGIEMLHLSYERSQFSKGKMQTQMGDADARFNGKIPLMITEHPFQTEYLIDRKGVKHEIIRIADKSIIL